MVAEVPHREVLAARVGTEGREDRGACHAEMWARGEHHRKDPYPTGRNSRGGGFKPARATSSGISLGSKSV